MNPSTSIPEPMKTMAVYILNRRVHIPIARTASVNIPIKTAKAPFSGIDGRYPQYDSTIGHVWRVHAARHAFRSGEVPFRHLIWEAKPEFSMVFRCCWTDRRWRARRRKLNIRPYPMDGG